MKVPAAVGVPLIVIVLLAQVADTPAGKPLTPETPVLDIPVAPVVVCVIAVNNVLLHKVGVDEATLAVVGDEVTCSCRLPVGVPKAQLPAEM